MNKKDNISKRQILVRALLIAAFLIEVLNIILTWSLGSAQTDVCPKSTFPGHLSIAIGFLSVLVVLTTVIFGKNKILAVIVFVLWLATVLCIGYVLQFFAVGGLDWCGFLRS